MADDKIIQRTYEFKLRMNRKFEEACLRALDDARAVYNAALEQRISLYTYAGRSIGYYEQSRQLTEARELPEVKACLRSIQQDALERLALAFQAFFKRVKKGQSPGFPRFKARDRYHTFSQKIEKVRGCPLKGDKLTVPGVGTCRVRLSREIEGTVKQLRITRRCDGWYALLVCDLPKPKALPQTGQSVGVDVGLTTFATLSTGEKIENPRHLKAAEKKLARTQRRLSKKKRGSSNRKKARAKVACTHLQVSRCRKDFHHKAAKSLVDRFDRIAVEGLNIKGMVRNTHLAKHISDAGWGQFLAITQSKAENAGRVFEKVPARFTSQTCSSCGHQQKMPLALRVFNCGGCGHTIDRDENAALNIRAGSPKSKPVESRRRDSEAGTDLPENVNSERHGRRERFLGLV